MDIWHKGIDAIEEKKNNTSWRLHEIGPAKLEDFALKLFLAIVRYFGTKLLALLNNGVTN